MPTFPDVPVAPGVPAVPRDPAAASAPPPTLLQPVAISPIATPVWGVFDASNRSVAVADSFLGVAFKSPSRVATAPQEQGAFASYNKVITPDQTLVRFSCGGSLAKRTSFLTALQAAKASLNLYSIVTPEQTYLNANIEDLTYRREANNGVGLLIVELSFIQIRIAQAKYTTTTKTASGASSVSGGRVQATPPSPPVKSALASLRDSGALSLFGVLPAP